MPRSARPLLSLLLAACAGPRGAADDESGPAWQDTTGAADTTGTSGITDAAVTYHRDIKPILDAKCVPCHVDRAIAPLALTTYEQARPFAEAIAIATRSGTMPPWPPAADCREYLDDRSLSAEQLATLQTWQELGAPAGDPADAPPPPPPPDPIAPDIELQLAYPYRPVQAPDEHRCFLLTWPRDQVSFVTALDLAPGEPRLVQRAIAYLIAPADVDAYRALDEADPDLGYPCFGGPGPGGAGPQPWLGAWTPGGTGGALPAGTGVRVEPGSLIALQIHYRPRADVDADQSRLRLRTAPDVEHPAVVLPFTDPNWVTGLSPMLIPAGEPDVAHDYALDIAGVLPLLYPDGPFVPGGSFVIRAAALHQHRLGTRSALAVVRGGGETDCILEIPRWDLDWQGSYALREPVPVAPGDQLRLACHWDNSIAHQPVVDGAPQAPRDVLWGEGASDEMCLGLLYITAD